MKPAHTTQYSLGICMASLAVLTLILWPTGLVLINATALALWIALQFDSLSASRHKMNDAARFTRRHDIGSGDSLDDRFVSVHLPIHNEPPDIVKSTLNALARLRHDAMEIIVIDNNTDDPGLWRPIESHCRALGPEFRFVHREDVEGAKAGALEIARSLMDDRTSHIAVVDADYQVTPDFLQLAFTALDESGAQFAQFPQSYREVTEQQQCVELELGDYFHRHAVAADRRGQMLLTGTLSVIDATALETVGGWPMQTITEDAELAMSLQRAGFAGVFVPQVAGRGLLPPSLHELQSQRHRWIVGNLQTLLRALIQSVMDHRQRVSAEHLAQLSAWCSFVTIPLVTLLAGVFLSLAELSDPAAWHRVSLMAAGTIIAQFLVTVWLSRSVPGLWFVRWTLASSSGMATLSGLTMRRMRFRCTRRSSTAVARIDTCQVLVPLLLLTSAICALSLSWFMATIALLLCALGSASTHSLDRTLRISSSAQCMNQPQGVTSSHGK
ncbi:glycosyltransferase family 2 protein [Granulosicoccus sp. 3-233]|uniref:glycosyltransferase family 2 protein n=1 Tax=Granulosicoccus sp. 3-233 TaxID=3417969 RepID=UPI003D32DA4C